MWVQSTWQTDEDIEDSLLLMAEYCVPTKEDIKYAEEHVPETILEYRKQMAKNKQRTLNSDIDESASYIVSGRGRGIRDRVIQPGGIVDYHPSDETELKKEIRQVAGFGYSNELIEQSIKAKEYDPEQCSSNSNSNLKMVSSSSSSKSSVENSPIKKKKSAISNNNEYKIRDGSPHIS